MTSGFTGEFPPPSIFTIRPQSHIFCLMLFHLMLTIRPGYPCMERSTNQPWKRHEGARAKFITSRFCEPGTFARGGSRFIPAPWRVIQALPRFRS